MTESSRLAALVAAESKAMMLLDAIESAGLIVPGRTERDVERDIYALAERSFGVRMRRQPPAGCLADRSRVTLSTIAVRGFSRSSRRRSRPEFHPW
jgi:hypothetical protein